MRSISANIVTNALLFPSAQKIEQAFAAYKIPVRVYNQQVGTNTVRYRFAILTGGKLAIVESLMEQIALALGVWSVRLMRPQGYLSLEIALAESRWITFGEIHHRLEQDPILYPKLLVPGTIILGRNGKDVPLLLRVPAQDIKNCLIVGAEGSGKTELARTMVKSIIQYQRPRDIQVAIFTSASTLNRFTLFAKSRNLVFPIVSEPAEILERINYLVSELRHRSLKQITRPHILVIIDELDILLKAGETVFEDLLCELVQHGNLAGISVVGCIQEPSRSAFNSAVYSVFSTRIVGHLPDARTTSRTGMEGTNAELLLGAGDFILVTGTQRIRFQAARISPCDLTENPKNKFKSSFLRIFKNR